LIRDHRQVENCLHWQKDRYWDEDKHYLRRPDKVFIGLTNWAVLLLHVLRRRGESIKATAEEVHYAPEKTLQVLGFKKE
jgi:hypothetical protein